MDGRKKSFGVILKIVMLCYIVTSCFLLFYKSSNNLMSNSKQNMKRFFVDAEIIQINDSDMLVKKMEDGNDMLVYIDEIPTSLLEGNRVIIEYDGTIEETDPPRIKATNISEKQNE